MLMGDEVPPRSDVVGRPYSFLQALKLGGVGSKRMMIDTVSLNMDAYVNKVADINYANIELRPNGVLVLINKGLRNFTWLIPYYQLVIYKSDGFSVHAQGKFIAFRNNRLLKENKKFIDKLMALKAAFVTQDGAYY